MIKDNPAPKRPGSTQLFNLLHDFSSEHLNTFFRTKFVFFSRKNQCFFEKNLLGGCYQFCLSTRPFRNTLDKVVSFGDDLPQASFQIGQEPHLMTISAGYGNHVVNPMSTIPKITMGRINHPQMVGSLLGFSPDQKQY